MRSVGLVFRAWFSQGELMKYRCNKRDAWRGVGVLLVMSVLCGSVALMGCSEPQSDVNSTIDASMLFLDSGMNDPADAQLFDLTLSEDVRVSVDLSLNAMDTSTVDASPILDAVVDMSLGEVMDARVEPDAFDINGLTHDEQVQWILAQFGVSQMRTRLPLAEIEQQAVDHPGSVTFLEALTRALESFLEDGTNEESPRSLAAMAPTSICASDDLRARVVCFLNRDTAYLELYGSTGFAPEEGEPLSRNWIFILRAESLSDHIQWAIVDRAGVEPTYNYGFN